MRDLPALHTTLRCPYCHADVGKLPRAGTTRLTCPRCALDYRIISGRVASLSSREILIKQDKKRATKEYRRTYMLGLQAGASLEYESFSIPGRDDRVPLSDGDIAAVVYSTRGLDEKVAVVNLTTGEDFTLQRPGSFAVFNAWAGGCLTALVLGVGLWAVGLGMPVSLLIAAAAALIVARWLDRAAPQPDLLSAAERRAIGERDGLRQEQDRTRARLREIRQARERRIALCSRLLALHARMTEVDARLYAPRLATVSEGVRTVERQVSLDDRLIAGYEKRLEILAIEIDVNLASEAMSDDVDRVLIAQQLELDEIAEAYRDLEFQLAANAEVERLLRSG